MKFKLKITKANGADLDDKKVIPVNNFLHTMIKQMSIKLNNTLMTQQNDTYAYKAYMESLLSYPKDSAESYLTCVLWYKDKAGSFDVVETSAGQPGADVPSLLPRQGFIDGSKILQVQGTPAHALFHTDKYLVGDVTINIRIDLQSEAFCLMSTAGTQRVEVRYVKITRCVYNTLPSCQEPVVNICNPLSTLWNAVMCRLTTLPRASRVPKRTICSLARYRDVWSWAWSETMPTWETKIATHSISSSLI